LQVSMSLGPDLRSTYFVVTALQALGGLPLEVGDDLAAWAGRYKDGSGWFIAQESLEAIDVAILLFRLGIALDRPDLISGTDFERLVQESMASVLPGAEAARVTRMAWVTQMLRTLAPSGHDDLVERLQAEILTQLPQLNPANDIGHAAGLSMAPASLDLPTGVRSDVVATLRGALTPGYAGPWTEHLLGLVMLGAAEPSDYAKAFEYWSDAGAPEYWGRVGAIEGFLLATAPPEMVPRHWPREWRTQLRTALLLRRVPPAGFSAPVVASSTPSTTAAAVIALKHAGADAELAARRPELSSLLCEAEADGNDPRFRALLLAEAIRLLQLDCEPPEPPRGEREIDQWVYSIATGKPIDGIGCPDYVDEPTTRQFLVLVGALAQPASARRQYVMDCLAANDLLEDPPLLSVWPLWVSTSLRLLAGIGVDEGEVLSALEGLRLGGGYGEEGAPAPAMGETCQAMVLKAMLREQRVMPVFCVT